MIHTIDELREQLRQHKLDRWEEKLVPLAKPAIAIQKQLTRNQDDIPLGASKLGGNPDLPQGIEWSFYQGKALTFIAQFKLSEVAPFDIEKILPERGMLYFFYEADEQPWTWDGAQESWKVIYIEDENTQLFSTPHPIQKGERGIIQALPCYQISYVPYLNLPIIFSTDEKDYDLEFTEKEGESYFHIADYQREPDHHLVGNPVQIQYYPVWDCIVARHQIKLKKITEPNHYRYSDEDLAFIRGEMANWQFLFQIDSDNELKVMWGDVGRLYICIPKESLKQRKFDDCWTVLQCS